MKCYFSNIEPEFCRTKQYLLDKMKDEEINELIVFEAKRITNDFMFYCREHMATGLVGDGCGLNCEDYNPRNGKSGCCKHRGFCYESTGIKKVLTLKNETKNL